MTTARRLLSADHHRMILMMHSEGKTDSEISSWLRESERIGMSRLAVNRLRRRLQGQAPQSTHTPQSTAAAGAAALADLEANADDLSVAELVDTLLRARWAVAVKSSRVGDGTAAATACRDFIGLAGLVERFPLERNEEQPVPQTEHVIFVTDPTVSGAAARGTGPLLQQEIDRIAQMDFT